MVPVNWRSRNPRCVVLDRNGIKYKCGESVVFQFDGKILTGKVIGKSGDETWVSIKVPKSNVGVLTIHTSHTVLVGTQDATIVLLRGKL